MWQTARFSSRPWWWRFAALSVRGTIAFMALIAAPLVWFSKSVRRMIVVVVIIAAPMAWISNNARVQREIVTAIEKAGGKVWYDFEWSDGGATGEMPIWPESLVRALGPDYFGNVVSVSFTSRATDAELIQVAKLERVERLDIYRSDVSDRGLAHLEGLSHLQILNLVRTKAGDAGLAQLAGMKSLRVLSLEGTELTDSGVAHLAGLTQLEDLNLASTSVSDAGLAHLTGLTKLQMLDLSRTRITDEGLAYLKPMSELRSLDLGRTKISDAGLAQLAGIPNLVELTLDHTDVTDVGLARIEGLERLTNLSLDKTKVTDDGVAKLELHRGSKSRGGRSRQTRNSTGSIKDPRAPDHALTGDLRGPQAVCETPRHAVWYVVKGTSARKESRHGSRSTRLLVSRCGTRRHGDPGRRVGTDVGGAAGATEQSAKACAGSFFYCFPGRCVVSRALG